MRLLQKKYNLGVLFILLCMVAFGGCVREQQQQNDRGQELFFDSWDIKYEQPDKVSSKENGLNVYRYRYYDEVAPGVYSTNPGFKLGNVNLYEEETALIVIDPWEDTQFDEVDEAVKKHIDKYLLTIVDRAIENNIKCFIFTNSPQYSPSEIADSLQERVKFSGWVELKYYQDIDGADEFGKYLYENGISNLIYVGYSIDQCVCFRPTGIIPMWASTYSFNLYLIPEGTMSCVSEDENYNNLMRENVCIELTENEIAKLILYKDYMDYWD